MAQANPHILSFRNVQALQAQVAACGFILARLANFADPLLVIDVERLLMDLLRSS